MCLHGAPLYTTVDPPPKDWEFSMHVFDSVPVLIRGGNSLWTFVCEITLVVVCNTLTEWLGMKGIFYHISTYPFFMPFYTEFFNFYLLYISFFRWGLRPQTPVIHFCPIDCTILAKKIFLHIIKDTRNKNIDKQILLYNMIKGVQRRSPRKNLGY